MQQGFDSEPAAPVDVAISEPPIAPVAVSFDSSPARAAPVPPRESRITPARRLTAWAADAALIGGLFAAHVAAAARVTGRDWGFLLTHAALPWLLLAAVLAFAWSWLFRTFERSL